MLAEPWDVLVVQEHAQDLGRPAGRGQDVMGLGVFEEGMYPAAVLRRTGTAATGTDRQGPAWHSRHDLLHPQVKAPPGGEVVVVGESFGWPQAKIPQPNPSRVSIEAGTTDIADVLLATLDDEPVQVRARPTEGDLQHRVQIGDRRVAGISRRRQISGLTPRTTTRSWYTLGRGAGCMVSGMAPILASRCGRMAPGTAPPTVCPALHNRGAAWRARPAAAAAAIGAALPAPVRRAFTG